MSATITATCPECQTRYHLKPEMVGRRMRCTRADCGEVFAVTPAEGVVAEAKTDAGLGAVAWDWRSDPPPVQAGRPVADRSANGVAQQVPAVNPKYAERNRRTWVTAGLAVFVVGTLIVGTVVVAQRYARAESRLAEQADRCYTDARFAQAAERYAELAATYPRALRSGEYQFLAALSAVRAQVANVPPDGEASASSLERFLGEHGQSAYLSARRADFFDAAKKTASQLSGEGMERLKATPPDVPGAARSERLARQVTGVVERYASPGADMTPARTQLQSLANAVSAAQSAAQSRANVLKLLAGPRPDFAAARGLMVKTGLQADSEILTAWRTATAGTRAAVAFRPLNRAAAGAIQDNIGGIVPEPPPPAGTGPRVPALAGGVLYGVEAKSARVAWVDRVGLEAKLTTMDAGTWLVSTADPPELSARDAATGTVRWRQRLPAAPLGAPAFSLELNAVVVALDGPAGVVVLIDAASGVLRGEFETGQPLAGGVGRRTGSTRFCVPARSHFVYVFDGAPDDGGAAPQCVGVVETGHESDSIRTAPVVVPGGDGRFLILLTLADGLDSTVVRVVTVSDSLAETPAPADSARLPGWAWFAPTADAERVTAVTDRGVLGLFGLRQPGTLDRPIFPLVDPLRVSPDGGPPRRSLIAFTSHSLIVTAAGEQLQAWRLGVDRARGWTVRPVWSKPHDLGTPLNEPTVIGDVMYATTYRYQPPATLFSAVRLATGELIVQRVLGFAPDVPFAPFGGGVVTADPTGAVIAIDDAPGSSGWRLTGKQLAGAVDGLTGRPVMVADTSGLMTVTAPAGQKINIRRMTPTGSADARSVTVPAALAGTPGIGPAASVLPLANGQLVRVTHDADSTPTAGPTWRIAGAGPEAVGHVKHWYDHNYLLTDGSRRLLRLRWPGGADYELATATALERSRRLLGPPVLLPGEPRRAAVADAGGTVLVVRGDRLEIKRTWRLGNDERPITAGPAWLAGRLFVTLKDRELVALDPAADAPLWRFTTPGDGLVGLPVPLADRLAVADRSGRIWLLDPTTGRPANDAGYLIPVPAAASATPVPLPGDRLFVPLTDGTAVIVSADELGRP